MAAAHCWAIRGQAGNGSGSTPLASPRRRRYTEADERDAALAGIGGGDGGEGRMTSEPEWSADPDGDTAPGPDEYEIEIEDVQRTRPRRRGLLLVFGRLLWGAGPAPRAEVQIVSADGTITHARNVSFGVFAKPPEEGPNRIHLVLGEVTWEGLRAGDRIREPAE